MGCCGLLCLFRSSIYRKANAVNKENICVEFQFVFMMNRSLVVMIIFHSFQQLCCIRQTAVKQHQDTDKTLLTSTGKT